MATFASSGSVERYDVRTIVGGGVKLGLLTVAGVVVFALLSRWISGTLEVVIQSIIIMVGGAVCSYLPPFWVRPRTADAIGWSSLLGMLGALSFTVVDTVLLRPLKLYHWTWDAIGGGSGFWYIPVWWMGATFLAWLGSMAVAYRAESGGDEGLTLAAGQTVGIAVAAFAVLTATGVAPFHSAIAALAYGLALIIQVPLSAASRRK